ncbi:MAG: hypothetical protein HY905_21290 [Deltaproteobacteria bacterium]|nr:hypothetical protein [Deltaproteobacteria bacterium]
MSAVDDVVARSRQPGGFVAHKRFAVARSRAVQKLRRFALASPHYYILELIQAAVANGADFVDVELGRREIGLSYTGGGFAPDELAQLFDFLFASKENLDTADVRQLALGLNALLDAQPDEILLESGDGTLARTTRVRIDGRSEAVEVGTPQYALRGTFIRVSGLKRGPLGDGSRQGEQRAIETRCLTAPVPIVVNSEPIFGYGRMRTPRLLGYDSVLSFDEGDLYGTVGLGGTEGESFFQLLTWGVWLDSVKADVLPGTLLGGVVGFDRLHKTADHAAVVQDDRLQELFTRLRPYARMLAEGRRGAATHEMWTVDGRPLRTSDIRATFRQHRTVVAVPRGKPGERLERARRAAELGAALQAPVVLLGADDAPALRLLGGPDARVVLPDVSDGADLAFYRRPTDDPPGRPWLVAPIDVEPLPIPRLLELAERDGLVPPRGDRETERLHVWLREAAAVGDVRATIYAPERIAPGVELWVDTLVTGRRIVAGNMPSPFPGFVLRVELPDASPRGWQRPWPGRPQATPAGILSAALAHHVVPALETAARRLLTGLGQLPVEPGSAAARIALAALARSALKRLRSTPDGSVEVRFSILDPALPDALLDLPLLRTLDGNAVSLRTLEKLVDASAGVVYGAVREVPPDLDGLDRSRILDLDLHQERMLIGLLGEAAYVRVDRRDVLAQAAGVLCRDFALGLRPFPDFPLLVEGVDPAALPPIQRSAVEAALVERLVAVFRGARGDEESRRQAARHLMWFVYRKAAHRAGGDDDYGVSLLPLFLDADGVPRSLAQLRPALASPAGLRMHDGWSTDVATLAPPTPPSPSPLPPSADPRPPTPDPILSPSPIPQPPLAMNPLSFRLLSQLGRVRPAFDFDLSDAEALADPAPPETAYAAAVTIDDEFAAGTSGVPMLEPSDPAIAVLDLRSRRVGAVRDPAGKAGVVGRLEVKVASLPPDVLGLLVDRAIASLLDEVTRRIPALAPGSPERERCVRAALRLAARRVVLTAQPDGTVALDVLDAPARRALDLPLFPTPDGIAASGWMVLREFAASRSGTAPPGPSFALASDAPPFLRSWLAATCCDQRIVRPASHSADANRTAEPNRVLQDAAAPNPPPTPNRALRGAAASPGPATLAFSTPDCDPDGGDFGRRLTEAMRRLHEECAAPGSPIEVAVWDTSTVPAQANIAQGRTIFLQPTSDGPRLIFDTRHWLLARARAHGPADPESLAWLLLAASAQINVALESITNRTELDLQARLLDLLERGALVPPDRA